MSDKKDRKDGMMNPDETTAADTTVAQEGDEGFAEVQAPAEEKQDGLQMVKDRRDRRDAEGDPEDMDKAMGVIAQQDEDIDTLLGIIDCLKAANMDSEESETPAENEDSEEADEKNCDADTKDDSGRADSATDFRELLRVVRIGDRLNMDGLETMTVKNAKKAVLKKLKPSLRLDGKSAAYVNAAFDMAVSDMKARKDTNYQRQQMMNKDSKPASRAVGSAADARQKMIDRRMKKEEK